MLTEMLANDDDFDNPPSAVATEAVTSTSLGLDMSDEELESTAPKSSFAEAFGSIKRKTSTCNKSTTVSERDDTHSLHTNRSNADDDIDPLEKELRSMEDRMHKIRAELAKKKNLSSSESKGFTKLTNTPAPGIREKSKILTHEEKQKVLERLRESKKSIVHGGDTDSEDDEDNRNPFEPSYSSYGKAIKKLTSESTNAAYSSRNKFTDYSSPSIQQRTASSEKSFQNLANKKQQVLDKLKSPNAWKNVNGSLVNLTQVNSHQAGPSTTNAVREPYSGIYVV